MRKLHCEERVRSHDWSVIFPSTLLATVYYAFYRAGNILLLVVLIESRIIKKGYQVVNYPWSVRHTM